jgi:glycerol uptake facilitator protein
MSNFVAELVGTLLLVLLGNGVVAGHVLKKSKSNNSGWIVITMGWGLAVAMSVFAVALYSGAHLNPAVSLAALINGLEVPVNGVNTVMTFGLFLQYVSAQMIGAILGALLVFVMYFPHFEEHTKEDSALGIFATGPAIRNPVFNLISEAIGTFVLVFVILNFKDVGSLQPLVVGFLVVGIGLSLGGTTGYAINPARDLGPRIVHQLLTLTKVNLLKTKADSDWNYAWIPVVGPLLGGALAAVVTTLLVG